MPQPDGFFERVYRVVQAVPEGRVTTYGAIAAAVGSPESSRMVGWAMNKAFSHSSFVPAHRVVNRKGRLTGKHAFPGQKTMQEMLESEGVRVKNDQVVDFDERFWAPASLDFK